MALTGRFVLLLALGGIPVVAFGGAGAAQAWMAAGAWALACCLAATADVVLAASVRAIGVGRELPSRCLLGEPATSVLHLGNGGTRRARALVRDGWQPTAGVATDGRDPRLRCTIPPGESRTLWLRLVPRRRGLVRSEFVTVRTTGPLGLAARQASLPVPGSLTVLPAFRSRRQLPSRLRMLRELTGQTPLLQRGQGSEFDALRDYVRGDDVRSLDWRATARRIVTVPGVAAAGGASAQGAPAGPAAPSGHPAPLGPGASSGRGTAPAHPVVRPVVRTWRPERDRHLVLVLDSSRLAAARLGDGTRFDASVEAALFLAVLADRAGDRVELIVFDRRLRARVAGARGRALPAAIVDAVAKLQPELIEADWDRLPAQVEALGRRRSLVVVFGALEAPGSSAGMLAALPQLCARHLVIVAAAVDPAAEHAPAPAEPGDGRVSRSAVYRAAAAERAALDTRRVAEGVRRVGAHVVSAVPDLLPTAIADRYIAMKAAGRL